MDSSMEKIAERRIKNILSTYIYCCEKQLESKICEAGPGRQRPLPHVLSAALAGMVQRGEVIAERINATGFYYLQDNFERQPLRFEQRKQQVLELYRCYRELAGTKEHCGDQLERIVSNAMKAAGTLEVHSVSANAEFDIEATLPESNILILCETKNYRPWMYPNDKEVREFFAKCERRAAVNEEYVLPVFITRKIAPSTFAEFKRRGGMTWASNNQFFSPSITSQLIAVKAKEGLGFHDIRFVSEAPASLIKFFREAIPSKAVAAAQRFHSRHGIALPSSFELD